MTEVFVSFEVAKLLATCGYPQNECGGIVYDKDSNECHVRDLGLDVNDIEFYVRPTQALATKWLREVKNVHICPAFQTNTKCYNVVLTFANVNPMRSAMQFKTYEESVEFALKAACNRLIKEGNVGTTEDNVEEKEDE